MYGHKCKVFAPVIFSNDMKGSLIDRIVEEILMVADAAVIPAGGFQGFAVMSIDRYSLISRLK